MAHFRYEDTRFFCKFVMQFYFLFHSSPATFSRKLLTIRKTQPYIRAHKHSVAICLVNAIKDNDMLKINEPTHNHA